MLPRLLGQLKAMGIDRDIEPRVGRCPLAAGGECRYTITLRFDQDDPPRH